MVEIYAKDMLYAQGFKLSDEQRAELKAGADRFRNLTGETDLTAMNVPVRDIYTESVIGYLTYNM